MEYIRPLIIEIFTTLLLQDKPIEVEKDYWWDEHTEIDKNEELKPTPQPFFPYFEQYLDEKKLKDIITISETEDASIITLRDTPQAKIKLKKFLQNYIDAYRRGRLKPDRFVNYFSYPRNLDEMKDILYELSDGFRQKKIILYSYRLIKENKFTKKPDKLANEKIRLSEFILDLYFNSKFEELIKINSCNMKPAGLMAVGNVVLELNITLLKPPETIYNILSKQLIFEQSNFLDEQNNKMRLQFAHIIEENANLQKFYILLDQNKIYFKREHYDKLHKIINQKEKISTKEKGMKGLKHTINEKIKEALKDDDFEFLTTAEYKFV